ncbi:SDR family oxidoreductase [Saccharospirillum salsuginis]|uniref:Oxidoreductase n=1 Tax=Saccharospirillum salsuginis TaxID=418750 RepID=A0A918K438_9GAMM|nr:SDR family oxidoreductase [Saccharospirillum salsuginis]GGX47634.1 oxidoreductase [Saccharospirillum salsuginis]
MKTVLITGANRGIGLAMVQQALEAGDEVIATCRRPEEAERILPQHERLRWVALDVTDETSIAALAKQLDDIGVDVLINNAGTYGPKGVPLGEVEAEPWLEVFRTNTIGPLLVTQAMLPALRRGSERKIAFVSSKVGSIDDNGSGGSYLYRSSKTALNQVMKSVSVDLSEEGFVVLALHPGWVQTRMGGPNALIDTDTSARGLLRVIQDSTPEQSGRFFNYDGSTIPW